jgi:hypothetical protein
MFCLIFFFFISEMIEQKLANHKENFELFCKNPKIANDGKNKKEEYLII